MLGQNMDPIIYREVVAELAKKIETAASNSPWDSIDIEGKWEVLLPDIDIDFDPYYLSTLLCWYQLLTYLI